MNRGISGQTTPQMLVRFQQDVVHLHPAAVVILAGTNDIAGNTGPSTNQMIEDNFTSMAEIAKQSGIKVVLASITPAYAYPWKPGIQPADRIRELNRWLKNFCSRNGYVYLDYYSSMSDAKGAMLPGLSSDGVHPTAQGYAVMAPLAERAIAQALGHSSIKAVSQLLWPVKGREVWFSLGENHEKAFLFGLLQLRNCPRPWARAWGSQAFSGCPRRSADQSSRLEIC